MPVILNTPDPKITTMSQLTWGQVAVIVGGLYDGYIVMRRSDNPQEGYMCLKNESTLVDGFGNLADHPVRVLKSGESFTVIIP